MTGADRALVLLAAGAIGVLAAHFWRPPQVPEVLVVETPAGVARYPMGPDRLLRVAGHQGTSVIEMRGPAARFRESPCRNRVCLRRGWLEDAGALAACVPNGILIRLEGPAAHGFDAVSY